MSNWKRNLALGILIALALAMLTGAAGQSQSDRYYFKSLGLLDDGAPYFIITEKVLWDRSQEFSTEPVPDSLLPEGFWLNNPAIDAVTYRYDGPADQGRTLLLDDRHFKENLELDQPN